jgi:hypothetical protein
MDSDSDNDADSATAYKSELPRNMLRYVRKWQFVIGLGEGIYENDIMVVGPPRPNEATCKSLLDTIEDACTFLNQCHQVRELLVAIQSNEPGPGNITRILNQIIELRNLRHSVFDVYSEYEDGNLRWNLKDSYGKHMCRTMALPEGAEAPEYIPDVEEVEGTEDEKDDEAIEEYTSDDDEDEESKDIFEYHHRDFFSDGYETSGSGDGDDSLYAFRYKQWTSRIRRARRIRYNEYGYA